MITLGDFLLGNIIVFGVAILIIFIIAFLIVLAESI